jgi:hypothetical protein
MNILLNTLLRWRWRILAVAAVCVALTAVVWLADVLLPLTSWDYIAEALPWIIGGVTGGLMAVIFGDSRAYAKGKQVGEQIGHDRGYQSGWEAAQQAAGHPPASRIPGAMRASVTWDRPLGFPHDGSHIYTTE